MYAPECMCSERPNRQIGEYCLSNTVCASDKCVRSKCVEPRDQSLQSLYAQPVGYECYYESQCESSICENNVCVNAEGSPCSHDWDCALSPEGNTVCQEGKCFIHRGLMNLEGEES